MPIHTGPHYIRSFRKGIWWKIIISCILLLGIGYVNSLWTHLDYKPWFNSLTLPSFTAQPRYIIGLIWSAMYILMGGSVGIVWHIAATSRYGIITKFARHGIILFILQIIVNMMVPAFMFGLNNLYLVLLGAIVNLAFVLIIFRYFFRLDRLSGFLLIPYIIWLIYAIALDIAFVVLN